MTDYGFPPPPPSQPAFEYCYRHPAVVTGVHCTRCGKPICPDCMTTAPVGYQCPDCVDSARKEFKQGAGKRVRRESGMSATMVLMGMLVAGYLLQQSNNAFFINGAMWPPGIAQGEYWRLITVMFLHASLLHLGVNLFSLWNLGTFLESALGRWRYVVLFLVTGFVASATSYAFGPINVPAVGASGAIFGIFGGLIAYMYLRRHTAMGKAILSQLMLWLAINVFISLQPGIDFRAHLGGLVAGFVTVYGLEEAEKRNLGKGAQIAVFAAVTFVGVVMVVMRTSAIRSVLGL